MIISRINDGIGIRTRNPETLEREEKVVSFKEFPPYFFIKKDSPYTEIENLMFKDRWGRFRLEINTEEGDYKNLEGEDLVKVTWNPSRPSYSYRLRDKLGQTYEADVAHHYRYAVDCIDEIPEYKMRKWYWDMEWMQGGEHDEAITCISMYDNYDETYSIYYWLPNQQEALDYQFQHHRYRTFTSEKKMLVTFLADMIDKDPDMLISWFGWKFDLPKLIERVVAHGLDPRLMSPFNEITGVNKSGYEEAIHNYSPISQPIKGRICVPLDMAFERQWNDAQRGTLPSMALDYVAETVLGEKKLVSEKFPDKNEFFARAWLEDTETYLEYARVDVELLVRIDEMQHTTEAILSLQRLLKAPFDACFYASNMGGIYFMRNAPWKAPTGEKGQRVSYDGAMVYDPLSESTNGLHLGVAAFDFAGLYPSMTIARNISFETISDEPTAFAVNIKTPKDFSAETEYEMMYFKTDELGILPKALLELKELRNEYKSLMRNAETTSGYNKWNNNQLAVKRLMASFYGIIAYQGFGWANVDLAASITASARQAIREAAFKARSL
tara:strand:- start:554 stop:2215 length:1662 start_codon:yes stop_codon:yes gene_type:complete